MKGNPIVLEAVLLETRFWPLGTVKLCFPCVSGLKRGNLGTSVMQRRQMAHQARRRPTKSGDGPPRAATGDVWAATGGHEQR